MTRRSRSYSKKRAGETDVAAIEKGDHDPVQTILNAPLPDARPRARKEILVPGGAGLGPRRVDQALILALARAKSWIRALRQSEYADTAEIAQRFGLSDAHVRRLLRFAYLAPDIVEAIVEGRQPRPVIVRLLLARIPLAWSEQRASFGFHPLG
jgi:site-specific DNA recombinase